MLVSGGVSKSLCFLAWWKTSPVLELSKTACWCILSVNKTHISCYSVGTALDFVCIWVFFFNKGLPLVYLPAWSESLEEMQVLTWIWAWKIDLKDSKPQLDGSHVVYPVGSMGLVYSPTFTMKISQMCIPCILRVCLFSVFLNETAWNVAAIFFRGFQRSSSAVPLTPSRCYFEHFRNPRSAFKPFALKLQSSMELSLCRVRVAILPGVLDVSGHCNHQSDATRNLQDVRPREGAAFWPSFCSNGVDFSSAMRWRFGIEPFEIYALPKLLCLWTSYIAS